MLFRSNILKDHKRERSAVYFSAGILENSSKKCYKKIVTAKELMEEHICETININHKELCGKRIDDTTISSDNFNKAGSLMSVIKIIYEKVLFNYINR